ncbi:MAG: LON peptidase substrate-binding domain-containing protein [Bosea sp.]|uniref:LON peptidase substrate-binding domain-containing protein n=1 Tax=Bosea sp. (in: a-proteobacteria) TaxID=1871050 RepID=UPI001AC250A2|nr:LON peptidase substrate-binding domain-containing protein [Bosea sp. (in: a-proteobacteria)]MBN9451747.1 LON peptidase substrate-binding domain-containing protein [Bosea sp. (in: a-proteobacteria)]
MGMNAVYEGARDCPEAIPLFPLGGALLLPRGQMPLNIFEPRYLAMIDDALKGERVIGIIQPEPETGRQPEIPPLLKVGCLGRITQFAETGDGRYIITLTGISRFRLLDELTVTTPYRQGRVGYDSFAADFVARTGEEEVDRKGLLKALRDFAKANDLKIDWKGVNEAPNEALVNALSMMCPFGPREKQALLEAQTLKDRAEVLVAITEIELARGGGDPDTTLQ